MTTVTTTLDGAVATAVLDGRGVNALDEEALAGLEAAVDSVERDATVRALVITGAGRTFCVGLDLDLLGAAFANHDYFTRVLRRVHALFLRIERLDVPVVAAVNGTTRAGGLELLLACDFAVVADSARVADHHMHFGVPPGGGATQRLIRKIGSQRARELILTGRWLVGSEVTDYGLAVRTVPAKELMRAVTDLVTPMARLPRAALRAAKSAMVEGDGLPMEQAIEVELAAFQRFLAGPGSDEGYRAFVEDRPPAWRQP